MSKGTGRVIHVYSPLLPGPYGPHGHRLLSGEAPLYSLYLKTPQGLHPFPRGVASRLELLLNEK